MPLEDSPRTLSSPIYFPKQRKYHTGFYRRMETFLKLAYINRCFFCIKDQQDLGSFKTEHCDTEKVKCDSLTEPGTIKRYQQERDEYMTRKRTSRNEEKRSDGERSNMEVSEESARRENLK